MWRGQLSLVHLSSHPQVDIFPAVKEAPSLLHFQISLISFNCVRACWNIFVFLQYKQYSCCSEAASPSDSHSMLTFYKTNSSESLKCVLLKRQAHLPSYKKPFLNFSVNIASPQHEQNSMSLVLC